MIRFSCLFVLASIFQVITSQGPHGPPGGPGGPPGFENLPEKCRGPPRGVENPEQCCQVEPMYSEDELASCGFKKVGEEDFQDRRGPPDCSKPFCLLQRKDLVDESNNIKYPAVALYLDQWAGNGPFKDAVEIAKAVCVQEGKVPGPPQVCEHARLMHCVGGVIFGNCPEEKWQQTDNCKALKDHMEECKAPFK